MEAFDRGRGGGMEAKRVGFGSDREDGIQCGIYCARFLGRQRVFISRICLLAASERGTRALLQI